MSYLSKRNLHFLFGSEAGAVSSVPSVFCLSSSSAALSAITSDAFSNTFAVRLLSVSLAFSCRCSEDFSKTFYLALDLKYSFLSSVDNSENLFSSFPSASFFFSFYAPKSTSFISVPSLVITSW